MFHISVGLISPAICDRLEKSGVPWAKLERWLGDRFLKTDQSDFFMARGLGGAFWKQWDAGIRHNQTLSIVLNSSSSKNTASSS